MCGAADEGRVGLSLSLSLSVCLCVCVCVGGNSVPFAWTFFMSATALATLCFKSKLIDIANGFKIK